MTMASLCLLFLLTLLFLALFTLDRDDDELVFSRREDEETAVEVVTPLSTSTLLIAARCAAALAADRLALSKVPSLFCILGDDNAAVKV